MPLETASFINGLNSANPTATDPISQGDDHIRLLKSAVKATFPNLTGAVTPTQTELNYSAGVTSAIQTQLDAKSPILSPAFTGTPTVPTAATATNSTQIASTAFVKAVVATVTLASLGLSASAAELNHTAGVTSNIQTQINSKQANLGFTPVQQSGGGGQYSNKIYLGWGGDALRLTVDATDFGRLVHEDRLPWLIASYATGGVGTYAFLATNGTSTEDFWASGLYAGTSLRWGSVYGAVQSYGVISAQGGSPAGTWRCMGGAVLGGANVTRVTLFLRIA
jgi:hypothetical protein